MEAGVLPTNKTWGTERLPGSWGTERLPGSSLGAQW